MDSQLEVQPEAGVDDAQLNLAERGQATPSAALAVVVAVFSAAATVDAWLARIETVLRAYHGAWSDDEIEQAAQRLPGSAVAWRAILRVIGHPGVRRLDPASTGREMDIPLAELTHAIKSAHRRCGAAVEVMCLEAVNKLLAETDDTTVSWRSVRSEVERLGRKTVTTSEDLKALRSFQTCTTVIGRVLDSVGEGKVERELVLPIVKTLQQKLQEFINS